LPKHETCPLRKWGLILKYETISSRFETNLISRKTYLIKRKKIFNKAQAIQKKQQIKEYWRGWKDYGASL
jgi:hypothetical protein